VNVFKDKQGRSWELEISFGAAVRMKQETGFDLDAAQDATGQTLVAAIYGHPRTLAEVLWFLVRDRAGRANLTREEFEDALTPTVLDEAGDALWGAIADFIHRRRSPAVKARLPEILKRIDDAATRAALAFDLDAPGSSGSAGSSPG
jgi:hypothetical protein